MQFFFQYKAINYTNKPLSLDALKFVTIMIGLFQVVLGTNIEHFGSSACLYRSTNHRTAAIFTKQHSCKQFYLLFVYCIQVSFQEYICNLKYFFAHNRLMRIFYADPIGWMDTDLLFILITDRGTFPLLQDADIYLVL